MNLIEKGNKKLKNLLNILMIIFGIIYVINGWHRVNKASIEAIGYF